jgi:hypothetical protein
MSRAQRLQQGPPRELKHERALFPIGLSPTQFCESLSRTAIAITIIETDRPSGRAGVTYSTVSTACDTLPRPLLRLKRASAASNRWRCSSTGTPYFMVSATIVAGRRAPLQRTAVNDFSAQHRRKRLVRTRIGGGLRTDRTVSTRRDQRRISDCGSTRSQAGLWTTASLQYCRTRRGDP